MLLSHHDHDHYHYLNPYYIIIIIINNIPLGSYHYRFSTDIRHCYRYLQHEYHCQHYYYITVTINTSFKNGVILPLTAYTHLVARK